MISCIELVSMSLNFLEGLYPQKISPGLQTIKVKRGIWTGSSSPGWYLLRFRLKITGLTFASRTAMDLRPVEPLHFPKNEGERKDF